MIVAARELTRFVGEALVAVGMREADAAAMAGELVAADLAGDSACGVRMLPGYVDACRSGVVVPDAVPRVELDHGGVLRVDGGGGFGQVTFRLVADLVVERARAHGVCAVAVRNTFYVGRVGDLCERAARRGVVSLAFLTCAGGLQVVAPPGADEGRLSTNPVAAGVPRSDPAGPPLVVDLATSVVAAAQVAQARERGEPVPAHWVTPSGALRPMAGGKGFALALVAEALGGALAGAGVVGPDPGPAGQGALVIGLDVAWWRPLAEFTADLDAALDHVRGAPVPVGEPPVRIPGERAAATTAQRRADGVPLAEATWHALHQLAEEFAVPFPLPLPSP